jgi:hypothetical protein
MSRRRATLSLTGLLLATFVATDAGASPARKFFPDDPLWLDRDDHVDVGHPEPSRLSDYYDFLINSFGHPGDRKQLRAANINTLGEVPDSSWFEKRHGRRRMELAALLRGPNSGEGPAQDTAWTVVRGKSEGVTPGLQIRDGRGEVYLIKFDPPGHLEMATAAEVISTKFFYAIGYHVPENYLVLFSKDQLRLDSGATILDERGRNRPMEARDLDQVLDGVPRLPDGRYRAVASKFLAGRPLGPFRFYGTRSDDPNDVYPHEHRRELRGLSVFSAWLNHDDSRAVNTLDMVVERGGRRYIQHHLIDFGSTLGSGSVKPQAPRAGYEYIWEPRPALGRILSLGLWDRPWIRIPYPDFPSIGRFEAEHFRPESWKPEYPNPAFLNCLPEDAYWAAKIVMAFTDEEIRAIVSTGALTDPRAEEYLWRTLVQRRDKVGQYWLNRVSSIDRLQFDASGDLRFEHSASRYGFSEPPKDYRAAWFHYDNLQDRRTALGQERFLTEPRIALPADVRPGSPDRYFMVRIQEADTQRSVRVFLRASRSEVQIVGIERKG